STSSPLSRCPSRPACPSNPSSPDGVFDRLRPSLPVRAARRRSMKSGGDPARNGPERATEAEGPSKELFCVSYVVTPEFLQLQILLSAALVKKNYSHLRSGGLFLLNRGRQPSQLLNHGLQNFERVIDVLSGVVFAEAES